MDEKNSTAAPTGATDDDDIAMDSPAEKIFNWVIYYVIEPIFFLFVRRQPSSVTIVR